MWKIEIHDTPVCHRLQTLRGSSLEAFGAAVLWTHCGPGRMQQPVFWETLSVSPASCLRLCDCLSAPDLCLLGTLVLAGEGIRSGEWLVAC